MDHRSLLQHGSSLRAGLIAAGLLLTLPAIAAEPAAPHPSPLAGVTALDRPVTYIETKIPLGELVAKVAEDTGVRLTASREVADEPVAVVVKRLPARELLEQLADLLDYQWHRRSGHRAPNDESTRSAGTRTPTFEIYQDLASRQREAALRDARVREAEKQLALALQRYAAVAALSQEQIQALLDEGEQRRRELTQMTLEQRLTALRSPEERERLLRFGMANELATPISRVLARFAARLSPAQWALLRQDQPLVCSTDPQNGELPLPTETVRALAGSRLMIIRPGLAGRIADPDIEAQRRREEKEAQDRWASAPGYRVTVRLVDERLQSDGTLSLSLRAEAMAGTQEGPPSSGPAAESLEVQSIPEEFAQAGAEDTAERQAALEKDPVLGVKKRFQLETKPPPGPLPLAAGPAAMIPAAWRLRDLLPDLARVYDVSIIADAYTATRGRRWRREELPAEPTALFALLDSLTGISYHWDRVPTKSGARGLIRLRSRTWFLDRPREIPLRLIRRWKALYRQSGILPFEEYVRMATELTDTQFESLPTVDFEERLSMGGLDLFAIQRGRYALRLYGALSPGQQQVLWRGGAIPVAEMTPGERKLFLTAVREAIRERAPAPDLGEWQAGSFSLRVQPIIRTIVRDDNGVGISSEPAPPPGAPPPPAASSGPALAPSPPPSPAASPAGGSTVRQQAVDIHFSLAYAPREQEEIVIPAAPRR